MYCIIYKFEVKENCSESFIEGWAGLTRETYRNEGSLGSRLHKVSSSEYIAYAQWPSEEVYNNADNMSEEAHAYRNKMRACCSKIEVLQKMEMVKDLLV